MKRSRWTSDLHWVRTSQQTRSEKTQAKLLDAAEELFGERGIDNASVADIAEHAGCSIGAVYHHFSDKKALLYALFDRICEEFEATSRAAVDPSRWEGATMGDLLQGFIEFSIGAVADRPSSRLPGLEIARSDPALREQYDKMLTNADHDLTELFLSRRSEIGHHDPELAMKFVLDQLGSMFRSRLTGDSLPTRFGDQDDEQFTMEALRSVCGYLRVDLPAGFCAS